MSKIVFTEQAFSDYLYWQGQDKKTLKRINSLLRDIDRNGYTGIGKPEPLQGDLTGLWSRRIDDMHRLVYRITGDNIEVIQCKGHYDKIRRHTPSYFFLIPFTPPSPRPRLPFRSVRFPKRKRPIFFGLSSISSLYYLTFFGTIGCDFS